MRSIILQANNVVTNRSTELQNAAISSGDDEQKTKYGLWVSPVYSQAKQKMQDEASGYKLKSSGAVFGFDSLVKDDLIIGVALVDLVQKCPIEIKKLVIELKEKVIYSLYTDYTIFQLNYLVNVYYLMEKLELRIMKDA
ncbi:MAG: autotransporter outer membrane beta-barrel domain-containing protein [Candidatus Rickettsia vulgarisii]